MVVGFLTPQRNAMTLAAKVGIIENSRDVMKTSACALPQDVNSTFVGLYRQVGHESLREMWAGAAGRHPEGLPWWFQALDRSFWQILRLQSDIQYIIV